MSEFLSWTLHRYIYKERHKTQGRERMIVKMIVTIRKMKERKRMKKIVWTQKQKKNYSKSKKKSSKRE